MTRREQSTVIPTANETADFEHAINELGEEQARLLNLQVELGLLRPVRRTQDGSVTEYELTHAGRVLASR